MPSRMALDKVKVSGDLEVASGAIEVRAGTAYVYAPEGATTKEGVLRVDRLNRMSWTVVFEDGSQWTVTRPQRGCGCR